MGLSLPFFILQPQTGYHIAALLLFIVGAWLDYLDGIIARRFSLESQAGKFIDPLADKLLIFAPLTTFSFLGLFSPWWLVPLYAREMIVTFCRIGWLLEGRVIGAENLGKVKLGFQVAVVIFAFFWFLSKGVSLPDVYITSLVITTTLLLLVTVLLTVASGISFLNHNRKLFRSVEFARYISACGVGLIPIVPGTWGSGLGMLLVFLIQWHWTIYLASFLFILWAGYWAVSRIDLSAEKDPHFVVIDEVLGIFVVFMGIPLNLTSVLAGFILFRLFDVVKPFPLRKLEKLPDYWGILCDDLGAGLYVWLILRIFFHGS